MNNNQKKRKGFALIELLIVIAIVAVLGGIGAAKLLSSSKDLTQAELDKYAEIIYTAAQNRLIQLERSGLSERYDPNNTSGVIKMSYEKMGLSKGDMAYFTNDSGAADDLVPVDRVDEYLKNGSWVIEYDYKTAIIRGVFFSKDTLPNYEEKIDYYNGNRDASERKHNKIGYYDGGQISRDELVELHPTVTVVNTEYDKTWTTTTAATEYDLKAKFSCDKGKLSDSDEIAFVFTLYPYVNGNPLMSEGITRVVNATREGGKYFAEYTLDSLVTTKFGNIKSQDGKEQINSAYIGGQYMIEVEAQGLTTLTVSSTDNDIFNPLFGDSSKDGVAEIHNPRHLQNLNNLPASTSVAAISVAAIRKNIAWPEGTAFTPISNSSLKVFDGNKNGIKGLNDSLFNSFTGDKIQNLDLIDSQISNSQDSNNYGNAGALAKYISTSGTTYITRVGAYFSTTNASVQSVSSCAIVSELKCAGGLIGKAGSSNGGKEIILENCFAALTITNKGEQYSGGLIGLVFNVGVTLKNCYSDSYVLGPNTGGLVGYINGENAAVEIQNCYAAGYLYGTNIQGGIAAKISKASLTITNNSYTVCEFMGSSTIKYTTMPNKNVTLENGCKLYYLNKGTVTLDPAKEVSLSTPTDLNGLGGSFTKAGDQAANAYNLISQYEKYPNEPEFYEYPGIKGLPHYGDWGPIGKINIAAEVKNGEKLVAYVTLSGIGAKEDTVVSYKFEGVSSGAIKTVTLSGINTSYVIDSIETESTRFKIVFAESDNDKSFKPGEYISLTVSDGKSSTDPIYFNSIYYDVPDGAIDSKDGTNFNTKHANIGCGRHLQNLDKNAYNDGDTMFKSAQLNCHIKFGSGSEWKKTYSSLKFTPIINSEIISFDGKGYKIMNLETTDTDYSGLFGDFGVHNGTTARTIKNVILVNPVVTGTFAEAGSLCGVVRGQTTIENCKVINPSVITTDRSNAGGLIGNARGNITVSGCAVYNDSTISVSVNNTKLNTTSKYQIYGDAASGGLVGITYNPPESKYTVKITNSYAAVVVGDISLIGNAGDHLSGGLIGRTAAVNTTISNCYADCYVGGKYSGGLVGFMNGNSPVNVSNSFAAGYVTASSAAAGFAYNNASTITVSNSYTIVKPVNTSNYYSTCYRSYTGKAYYVSSGSNDSYGTFIGNEYRKNPSKLATALGSAFTTSGVSSNPYNYMNNGLSANGYQMPLLKNLTQYGDWQKISQVKTGFVYYEIYSDGKFGLHYFDYADHSDNPHPLYTSDQLRNGVYVKGDGYGIVFSVNDPDAQTVLKNSSNQIKERTQTLTANSDINTNPRIVMDDCTIIGFPVSWMYAKNEGSYSTGTKYDFYQKLTIEYTGVLGKTSELYYYSPYYAKTAYHAESVEMPDTIAIRSPRQLFALSWMYPQYMGIGGFDGNAATQRKMDDITFTQEADLDYSRYQWTAYCGAEYGKQYPIGPAFFHFMSDYKGNYHYIKNIQLGSANNKQNNYSVAGLFGYLEDCNIDNLFIVNEDISKNVLSDGSCIGVFAGWVYRNVNITNCGVSGYKISFTDNNLNKLSVNSDRIGKCTMIGGFAGYVNSDCNITKCSSNTTIYVRTSSPRETYIAGFIGFLQENQSPSKNYAHVGQCHSITIMDAKNNSGYDIAMYNNSLKSYVNGFVCLNDSKIILHDCYSATSGLGTGDYGDFKTRDSNASGKVTASTSAYGYKEGKNSYSGMWNCYVLEGTYNYGGSNKTFDGKYSQYSNSTHVKSISSLTTSMTNLSVGFGNASGYSMPTILKDYQGKALFLGTDVK